MQYGIHVNSGAAVTDPAVLRDMAQLAEELGCESILIGDHLLPPQKIQTPFPVKMDNPPWHVYQEHDWPDCFTTLAFLAAITTRVRLGVSVIILPYRHPVAVTKMLTTLDRLSGGRIICGVGIGWLKDEFAFLGVPFSSRIRRSGSVAIACPPCAAWRAGETAGSRFFSRPRRFGTRRRPYTP
jgi:alkanesulfonate monooxygenase SsuD/methylene tetrahydromethanopterin reductase-like flavin-dependent oxidoreductase (luciferase family)